MNEKTPDYGDIHRLVQMTQEVVNTDDGLVH